MPRGRVVLVASYPVTRHICVYLKSKVLTSHPVSIFQAPVNLEVFRFKSSFPLINTNNSSFTMANTEDFGDDVSRQAQDSRAAAADRKDRTLMVLWM